MANEISVSIRFSVTQGYFSDSIDQEFNDDFPVIGKGGGIQKIGTSAETLNFGDVNYEGWLYMENLDTTNTIDWGPASGATWLACGKIPPGKAAIFYMKPGITIKAAARTAESRLLIQCYDTHTGT